MKERALKFIKRHKIAFLIVGIALIVSVSAIVYSFFWLQNYQKNNNLKTAKVIKQLLLPQVANAPGKVNSSKTSKQTNKETKKAISSNPPKYSTSGDLSGSTTKNPDGSSTTVVGEGGVDNGDLKNVSEGGSGGANPYSIKYSDQTGYYAGLETVLKDYLNSLKWGNEVGTLYQIIVKDAGDTGWAGQYGGSYYTDPSGNITSAFGWITLNVYYYKDLPYFNDYMKLVLSHEYGHHYTLYHKWVDWNLPIGTRFPDSYYAIRPLSKATTATDYSLGWGNCEAEIIAEDYSYLYSGYGYHAMSNTYGYPSDPGTRNWLNNIAHPIDNPPIISITTPANGANLSGSISFKANATDDVGVVKVVFYINDSVIFEDTSAPYENTINTATYANGAYTLKAVAFDAKQNTPTSISVNFSN